MSTHHHPTMFLPACTVIQADGEPPLTPIPEVSSMLEAPSAVGGSNAFLQCSLWTTLSTDGGPQSILHRSPPGVDPGAVICPTAPSTHVSCVHQPSDSGAVPDSRCAAHVLSHSACASSAHDYPPWDSHEHNGFRPLHTYNQLIEAHDNLPYAFGASWMFWHKNLQDLNFLVDPCTGTV